jgi:hypothetical protein
LNRYYFFLYTGLFVIVLTGCFYQAEYGDVRTPTIATFRLIPESLDFSRVRESDGTISLQLSIENLADTPLDLIEVLPGCHCIVLDKLGSVDANF